MLRSGLVRTRDVRAILKIVNELPDLPPDPAARTVHMMNEVCKLFGARSGIAGVANRDARSGDVIIRYGVAGGFLDESMVLVYQQYAAQEHVRDVLMTSIMQQPDPTGLFTRASQVPDRTWYNSAHFNEIRVPLGIDDAIYAFWPVPGAPLLAGIGLNRERGGRKFSKRELELAAILHDALIPFYRYLYDATCREPGPRLTPRTRQVYQQLMLGLSQKEIAVRLRMSPHTVHDHVKQVYTAFGVNSRAELMARR